MVALDDDAPRSHPSARRYVGPDDYADDAPLEEVQDERDDSDLVPRMMPPLELGKVH